MKVKAQHLVIGGVLATVVTVASCSPHTIVHRAPDRVRSATTTQVVAPGQLPECSTQQVISCLHVGGPEGSYWVDSEGAIYPLQDM